MANTKGNNAKKKEERVHLSLRENRLLAYRRLGNNIYSLEIFEN